MTFRQIRQNKNYVFLINLIFSLRWLPTVLATCCRFHSNIDYFLGAIRMKMKLGYSMFQDLRFRKKMNLVNFSCFHGNMTILKWPHFYFFSQMFRISFGKNFLIFCAHYFNVLQRRITFFRKIVRAEFCLFLKQ